MKIMDFNIFYTVSPIVVAWLFYIEVLKVLI